MNYPSVILLILVATLPAHASLPDTDFSRYQLILDRKPFGDVSTQAATDVAANPNQPPLASILKLVALEADESTGIIQAGIVDLASKKNHYLNVGDEEDGVKLVQAEYKGDRALVRKGDQEEWLSLGSGPKTSPAAPGNPAPPEVAQRQKMLELLQARNRARQNATPPPPNSSVPVSSSDPPNTPKFKNNEDMQEHYRKVNLNLIRGGGDKGPPLPIPLTPEDDATLVKEGVLPPQEAPAK